MTRRLTTREFIERARAVHGDRYDYSSVEYVNGSTKVTINCPDHGSFNQKPNGHLNGKGCRECGGRMPLTTETFIEKARAIHGDRYDYSLVDYVDSKTEVTIVCPDHDRFRQKPVYHINSRSGCPDCAGTKLLTTKTFVEKAKAVHGNKYDYSQVDYKNNRTYVTIICPEHTAFSQTPDSHLSGHGCPECGGTGRLSTNRFIEKAKLVHGSRYDYAKVDYLNSKTPVKIYCADHGYFYQRPNSHLSKQGCPDCAGKNITTKSFIEKAIAVHGGRYDYSQVDYVNSKTYVTIICREHDAFEQVPSSHLQGIGCPECGGRRKLTRKEFIKKAVAVHGDRYDYSAVRYTSAHRKVQIICRDHGPFDQVPYSHLYQPSGCPDCADVGFNPSKPGLLYYIAVAAENDDTRYKIGITNHSVNRRFRGADLTRVRTVRTWRFAIGRHAAKRESEILRKHAGDRYYGPPILESGNTELFTHDVLGLDKMGA